MTGINYLDETINATPGCSYLACKCRPTCWAKRDHDKRHKAYLAGKKMPIQYAKPFHEVQFFPARLDKPLHWKKPRRVGVCFTGDWMDDQVQCAWIDQILEVIAACPQHQFFSLTKQPQNLEEKIYGHCPESPARELGGGDYLPNLWNGVSICDQEDANRMLPDLLRIPGKHWVSCEPMLGHIELDESCPKDMHNFGWCWRADLDWLVIGCESGKNRRPMPLEWAVDVVQQCKAAGVPVYVKQLDIGGKVVHDINLFPTGMKVRQRP